MERKHLLFMVSAKTVFFFLLVYDRQNESGVYEFVKRICSNR